MYILNIIILTVNIKFVNGSFMFFFLSTRKGIEKAMLYSDSTPHFNQPHFKMPHVANGNCIDNDSLRAGSHIIPWSRS